MSSQVLTTNYHLSNPNDPSEWLAGGELRNESYPGGEYFSTLKMPSFNNKKASLDFSNVLTLGLFTSYLLPSLTNINNIVNQFDLLNLYSLEVNETRVIQYTITITDTSTQNVLDTSSNDIDISDYTNALTNTSTLSLEDLNAINENSFNIVSMISNPNPISITVSIVDLAYGKDMTFEQIIGAGLFGTVKSTMTSFVTNAVTQTLGLNNITQLLAAQTITGLIVGEFLEMALGLDNHFGFGGDFVGTDEYGNGLYAPEVSLEMGLLDTALEIGSFGFADTLTYNADIVSPTLTDIFGNVVANPDYIDYSPIYEFDDNGNPTGEYTSGEWNVSPNQYGGFDVTNTNTGVSISTNEVGDQINDDGSLVGSVNDQTEQSAFGDSDSNSSSDGDGSGYGGYGDYGSGNDGTSSSAGGDYGGYGEGDGNADGNNN